MIHLGDVVEFKNPDSATLTAAAGMFRAAADAGMDVDVALGNHDYSLFAISSSSIEPLVRLNDRITAYHEITARPIPGGFLVFLPYLHGVPPAEIKERLEKLLSGLSGNLYLCAHYGVVGSTVGPKNMVLPGDNLDADVLHAQRFKAILFGHIHKSQVVDLKFCKAWCPGSPVVMDSGERLDPKGYIILDTATGDIEWVKLSPKRHWLALLWNDPEALWTEKDIVKFVGDYAPTENPQETIRKRIEAGAPEPFFMSFDCKRYKNERLVRGEDLADKGGFREAAGAFIAKKWPGHPLSEKALRLVLEVLSESKAAVFDRHVVPISLIATNLLSYKSLKVNYKSGEPTLIVGPNESGKTNTLEALLFALTGEASKKAPNAQFVHQGAKEAYVSVLLQGERSWYKVERTITIGAKGASQKVKLASGPGPKGPWSNLADGGVRETQAILSQIVGATYTSLKATNFAIQDDKSPFFSAEPSERKAILGEILGFEPISKAYKTLNEGRLEVKRALSDATLRLEGLRGAWNPSQAAAARKQQEELSSTLPAQKRLVQEAETLWGTAKNVLPETEAKLAEVDKLIAAVPNSFFSCSAEKALLTSTKAAHEGVQGKRRDEFTSEAARIEQLKIEQASAASATATVAIITGLEQSFAEATEKHTKAQKDYSVLIVKKAEISTNVMTEENVFRLKQQDILRLSTEAVDTCSRCGQKVDSAHIKAEVEGLKAECATQTEIIARLNETLRNTDGALQMQYNQVTDWETAGKRLRQQLEDAKLVRQKAESYAGEIARAQARLTEIQALGVTANAEHEVRVAQLEGSIVNLDASCQREEQQRREFATKRSEITQKLTSDRDTVEALSKNLEGLRVRLASLQAGLEGLESQLKSFAEVGEKVAIAEKEISTLEKDMELKNMAAETLDPKTGLPVFLIDTKLPALEDRINYYMDILGANGRTVQLVTQTDEGKETLAVLVDNGVIPRLDIAMYSGGTHGRIEICLKLALSDLAEAMRDVNLGLIVFDEPAAYLDEERKGKLVELIYQRTTSGRTPVALVVSHDRQLISSFQHRYELRAGETEVVLG